MPTVEPPYLVDAGVRPRHLRRSRRRKAREALGRPAARRSVWTVVDQGVSSLTNLAASVVIARSVDRGAFGAFAIAFTVGMFVVALNRALVAQPLAVRVSARSEQREEVSAAAGAAVVCGGVAGLLTAGAALAIGGAVRAPLLVVAALLPALVLQDFWRLALFTMKRPARAAVNDLAWAGSQAALFAVVSALAVGGVAALTAAWAGGVLVPAVLGMHQTGVVPACRQARRYLRRHVDIGGPFALEFLFQSGSTQVVVLALGGIVGTAGVGAIRGGQMLFGPFWVVLFGLMSGLVPEGSRLLARSPRRLATILPVLSGGLVLLATAWGATLLAIPDAWGRAVLGEMWAAAQQVVAPLTVMTTGLAVTSGGILGLHILSAAGASLRLRTVAGSAAVVAGVTGGVVAGPAGGVAGLCAGAWINAAGAWWLLTRRLSMRRRRMPGAMATALPLPPQPLVPAGGGSGQVPSDVSLP